MIFKQIDELMHGAKTQTRRVLFEGEYALDEIDGVIVAIYKRDKRGNFRLTWLVGKTYAITPKRGLFAIEGKRIKVTALRVERLQSITEDDALAEGVASIDEYRALWEAINGKTSGARWQDNPMVTVYTFELVEGTKVQPQNAECPECMGYGYVLDQFDAFAFGCSRCEGKGYISHAD